MSTQQRLWSDWTDAQADLSLCWAHMPFCRFCHDRKKNENSNLVTWAYSEIQKTKEECNYICWERKSFLSCLTNLCRVDSSIINSLDSSLSYIRGFWLFLLLSCFVDIPVFNGNSVDPNQMPHLRYLIWIYTVYQYPFYGTLGINGLINCMNWPVCITEIAPGQCRHQQFIFCLI